MSSPLPSDSSTYDVFVSHASEDKEWVGRLAGQLQLRGLRVWFDRFVINPGDDITDKIGTGLAEARFGLFVLSPHFFSREWPKRELAELLARASRSEAVIFPLLHDMTVRDLEQHAPELARYHAITGNRPVEEVAAEIVYLVCRGGQRPEATYGRAVAEKHLRAAEFLDGQHIIADCHFSHCTIDGPGVLLMASDVHFLSCTFQHPDMFIS